MIEFNVLLNKEIKMVVLDHVGAFIQCSGLILTASLRPHWEWWLVGVAIPI
jgi:hypothetical protein